MLGAERDVVSVRSIIQMHAQKYICSDFNPSMLFSLCARTLVDMGSRKVVGIDVIQEMIAQVEKKTNSNSNVKSYIV